MKKSAYFNYLKYVINTDNGLYKSAITQLQQQIIIRMESPLQKKEARKQKMNSIRLSLKANPVISMTTNKIQAKLATTTKHKVSSSEANVNQLEDPSFQKCISIESTHEQSIFDQNYDMKQKVGEGAHGVIKRCIKKDGGEVCAVKILTLEKEHVVNLRNIFTVLKNLKHPNILEYKTLIFDIKLKKTYLVTDYLPFPCLDGIQIESEDELKLIIYQLLKVLSFIHQEKLCHRDIKPDNILYDRENKTIKVIDFDISKTIENRGRKIDLLTITGTPYYRAPEMFCGGGYDEKVDVWALGITMYQLMTGFTPFESESHHDTIKNIQNQEVKFPSHLKFECSQAASNLVKRLLKKQKSKRLTASEALKDSWFLSCQNSFSMEWIALPRLMSEELQFPDTRSPILKCNQSFTAFPKNEKDQMEFSKELSILLEQSESSILGMQESEIDNLP